MFVYSIGFSRQARGAKLLSMDSVRFGRALGFGARAAAKTLATAVDAATAPNPSKTPASPPPEASKPIAASAPETPAGAAGAKLGQQAVQTVAQVRQTGEGLKRGSQRFGEATWGPLTRLSGALWLEVTGFFFGIFALFAAQGAWRMRGEWHRTASNGDAHMHLLASAVMAVVFGYFCVSSFVRANRRTRQR
jgi:hypothetical protein